jgi:hypothetical protein
MIAEASVSIPTNSVSAVGRAVPDGIATEASVEAVQHFNIRVTASDTGSVESIRQLVEGRLVKDGYKINSNTPDITVQLKLRTSEFDRSGSYIRYEGTVEASIDRTWDQKHLGFEPISVRGERGLGEDEAMRNLTAQLAKPVSAFVLRVATARQTGLAVLDVTVKQSDLTPFNPEYAGQFISTVRAQSGVIYCAMVAHDYSNRVLTFRVAYLVDAMPEGLLNRLSNQSELHIKPRN